MNIFYTSSCPKEAASWLDDIRLNKMISESIQMLSACVYDRSLPEHLKDYTFGAMPKMFTKPSYMNHPCTKWVRSHHEHYAWLVRHCQHMIDLRKEGGASNTNEYKLDNCRSVYTLLDWDTNTLPKPVEPPYCGVVFDVPDWDSITITNRYRMYMLHKWQNDTIKVTWNYGTKPEWSNEYV